MDYTSPSKYILLTTEREMNEAGANIFGCNLKEAKSKKHATQYLQKMAKYRQKFTKTTKIGLTFILNLGGNINSLLLLIALKDLAKTSIDSAPQALRKFKNIYQEKCIKLSAASMKTEEMR